MIAFIPARSGSKSIQDKNIKMLGGKPLMAWSIEFALECGLVTIVSSDSDHYLDIAKEYGAKAFYRSPKFAKDTTPMFEVLRDAVTQINSDTIVLLQPTTPFRKRKELQAALKHFDDGGMTSLISVSPVPEKYHPEEVILETKHGYVMATGVPVWKRKTRRQDYLRAFVPTGAFYIFKASNIDGGSIYGSKPGVYVTEPTVNINTPEDWALAEIMANQWKI